MSGSLIKICLFFMNRYEYIFLIIQRYKDKVKVEQNHGVERGLKAI